MIVLPLIVLPRSTTWLTVLWPNVAAGSPAPHASFHRCDLSDFAAVRATAAALKSIAPISSDAALGWQKNLAQSLQMLAISDPDEAVSWVEADLDNRLRDGYTTSKEMLAVWVQHVAVKLGNERRIRLNAIGPCPAKTAFMDAQAPVLPDGFLDAWPYPSLGRMATAEEQAWPLVLLNSRLNAAITGAFLYTN
jgi:NAD(P)-dependent dehydrogenase (short-subunit alcohol dehydrogenase family)